MWELETRILLNFLTFLLIIIQFVICVRFSGFSLFMKVMPTARFHRKTTWTKQWQHTMTQQPITPEHINDTSTTYPPTRYYPTTYRAMHTTTYSITHQATDHTKRRTEQHTIQHTIHHMYDIQNTKQQSTSGPIRRPTKRPFQPIKQYDKPNSLQSIQQSTPWGYEE